MSKDTLQWLWAPWRISYILREKTDDCIFCKKAAAELSDDTENLVLARGENVFVMMNTYPYTPGHLLVCPYAHISAPELLTPAVQHELFDMTMTWRQRLNDVMHPQGMNIGLNLGDVAGAGIADHLHFHIVPRWKGDTNFMTTCADVRVVSQSLQELYALLTTNPQTEVSA